MRKRGFTLVELLAVIVVLAIIALIASPIITNIIGDSKKKAFEQKIYSIASAAEDYYSDNLLDSDQSEFKTDEFGNTYLSIDLSNEKQYSVLELKGKKVDKGKVYIDDKGDVTVTAIEGNFCGQKLPSSSLVDLLSLDDVYCNLLTDSSLSGSVGSVDSIFTKLTELQTKVDELSTKNKELTDSVKTLNDTKLTEDKVLNRIYPVGSIYISTDLDTVKKVKEKFGGTWEAYGVGRTLVGTASTSGATGGSSTISLLAANLPSHSHNVTAKGTISSTFTGKEVTSGSTGSGYTFGYKNLFRTTDPGNNKLNLRVPTSYLNWQSTNAYAGGSNGGMRGTTTSPTGTTGFENIYAEDNGIHSYYDLYLASLSGVQKHEHTVTAKGTIASTFTGSSATTSSVGSGTAFSVQNPYITVYMYKRIG